MARSKKYFIIYKPFKVLSQFTDEDGNAGLGSVFDVPKDVYPVGRLDLDSEGLLLLTNDKYLNGALLNPKNEHQRTYWVEVDGEPSQQALQQLRDGVTINVKGPYATRPCEVQVIDAPDLAERNPPVNYQKHPVRTWLEIKLIEGKNRQVRKMTAKVGHPTLRLVRVGIEDLSLFPLQPGELTQISRKALYKKLHIDLPQ
ncbi:pseudouridine synthase [Marinoscillum furvescens]|uniref:Pseudouridine synthase n=1 Tax=Marinoscillum furvescens DSM 4134 TaxID=1122208 RepID=A0A3D9L1C8_MARFU|nr:pseudouridine synthase [Marinoscillum furvescens]RED97866.1 ribosomal large subunit pseudouridine synthase E [Marinoscillum furvescens DSM 4134]